MMNLRLFIVMIEAGLGWGLWASGLLSFRIVLRHIGELALLLAMMRGLPVGINLFWEYWRCIVWVWYGNVCRPAEGLKNLGISIHFNNSFDQNHIAKS